MDGYAKFVRQMHILSDLLERDKEAGDTEAKIRELRNKMNKIDYLPRDEDIVVDDDGVTWEPLLDASGHEIRTRAM
jgi:hypothetical protein